MLSRLGYFVTESSEHFSEYVPWFIKRDRPDLLEHFNIPIDEYIGRCEDQLKGWDSLSDQFAQTQPNPQQDLSIIQNYGELQHDLWLQRMAGGSTEEVERERAIRKKRKDSAHSQTTQKVTHSGEYGSLIIHSMETGQPRVIYGNVPNHNLIDNLPTGCCVEVPCLVDKSGVQPTHIGALPPHLAALMQTNINVQSLTVEAALTRKRDHIYHAAMLDPHTAAELDLSQIWSLVDDLIEAHGDWLPKYD